MLRALTDLFAILPDVEYQVEAGLNKDISVQDARLALVRLAADIPDLYLECAANEACNAYCNEQRIDMQRFDYWVEREKAAEDKAATAAF